MINLRYNLAALSFIILFQVNGQINNEKYKLGVSFDSLNLPCTENFNLVFGSAELINGTSCKIDNFKFIIGIDKHRKVIYYATSDSSFKINNELYLRTTQTYLDSLKKLKIIYETGWNAYIRLTDGWNLAFKVKDITYLNGIRKLKDNAVPDFIFKKGYYYSEGAEVPQKWKKFRVKRPAD
jgi:hypothetical protein